MKSTIGIMAGNNIQYNTTPEDGTAMTVVTKALTKVGWHNTGCPWPCDDFSRTYSLLFSTMQFYLIIFFLFPCLPLLSFCVCNANVNVKSFFLTRSCDSSRFHVSFLFAFRNGPIKSARFFLLRWRMVAQGMVDGRYSIRPLALVWLDCHRSRRTWCWCMWG